MFIAQLAHSTVVATVKYGPRTTLTVVREGSEPSLREVENCLVCIACGVIEDGDQEAYRERRKQRSILLFLIIA